jgi:hypothetical protein
VINKNIDMMEKNELKLIDLIELSPAELQSINGGGIITDVISSVSPSSGILDFISAYSSTVITLTVQQLNLPPSLENMLIGLGRFLI